MMRNDIFGTNADEGHGNGLAVGRGGVLPRPEIPLTNKDIIGLDLTHVIYTSDIAAAKPGGGTGGGGGGTGGGGTSYSPYTAGAANGTAGYDITIEFSGTWTAALHDAFVRAADYYVSLIVGDLPDVKIVGNKGAPRTVDDIVISASLANIDGAGGILGQAGPISVRSVSSLPATATMQFDVADATYFDSLHLFDDIVVHEMGHSLGFGSIWDRLSLVDSSSHFTGAQAKAQSLSLYQTDVIAVETDGGSGTAGSHWDEDTYHNELMTGYIDNSNYFSAMSAASFGDLGYQLAGDYASHLIVV